MRSHNLWTSTTAAALGALLVGGVQSHPTADTTTFSDAPVPAIFTRDLDSSCPAAAWPPGPGEAIVPQMPDDELKSILEQVDPKRVEDIINKLVSFGTRHTLSTQTDPNRGIGAARDWIASQMREFAKESDGQMEVTVPSYIQGIGERISFPVRLSNVVATLKGCETPERIYVVSGHYDTRVVDVMNYTADAPGADDDGSGVAVSMELARVMAKHKPRSTIVFAAVAGEEQNLYGSNFLAQSYKNASANVAGMLDNDIVGSSTGDDGTKDPHTIRLFAQGLPLTESDEMTSLRQSVGGENDSPARELARFIAEVATNSITDMTVRVIYRLDRYLRGGDHSSFLMAGYESAVRFTEPRENFAHQHQDIRVENGTQYGDLAKFCDFDFIGRVARVNGATLWSLAQAPSTPNNITVDTTQLTNNSTLMWEASNDTNVAGYEVLWRSTIAPFWTDVIDAGTSTKVNLAISKDNVIFGVRAVGKNGFKSPAGFPFPAPAPS
ncbi:MAG: hypothetical protein M4579_006534 [Chaenotheca gracillima]|nr:MAG: hypothetical protein M4579_006534 [Chaenotheca gracillima]